VNANDAQPGSTDHPAHPFQESRRMVDLHFLDTVRTASEEQLLAMRAVFRRLGTFDASWKLKAVERALARMYSGWELCGG
jgi:hypothetical protein